MRLALIGNRRFLLVGKGEVDGQTLNASNPARHLQPAVCRRYFLAIVLPLHRLGGLVHCRIGSKRVALSTFPTSPPNRACGFHCTRLSSVSFHSAFLPDYGKHRFDSFTLRMSLCLSVWHTCLPSPCRRLSLSQPTMETPLPLGARHLGN